MRVRSLALVLATLATSSLLAAAALDCSLPPPPPGPQALATKIRRTQIAMIDVPAGGTVDRPALVASLREMKISAVILRSSATEAGEHTAERVSLAVDVQRELDDALVFIGTYDATAHKLNGKSMDALLQNDPTFDKCYAPNGPSLGVDLALVDKVRVCSQDVAQKVADELTRVNASPRIGCFIGQQPELADDLSYEGRAKLHDLLRDAAVPCAKTKRPVAVSPVLSTRPTDPDRASVVLREALKDTGVIVTILQDGVGTFEPTRPDRANAYYLALRVALDDREDLPMQVWASTEAFDCETPACDRTHPTSSDRYIKQLCGAQRRVEGIVTTEYLHDLAGQPLVTGDFDASAELKAIADDVDASAQLRRGYLEWSDAGASCAPK
jgi:hypothetical protein